MDKKRRNIIILAVVIFVALAAVYEHYYKMNLGSGNPRFGGRGEATMEIVMLDLTRSKVVEVLYEEEYDRTKVMVYINKGRQICLGSALVGFNDRYYALSVSESHTIDIYSEPRQSERFYGISDSKEDDELNQYANEWAKVDTLEQYEVQSEALGKTIYITVGLMKGEDGVIEY